MKFRLTDRPVRQDSEAYETAVTHLSDVLAAQPGLVSIYRMGSVSDPGISDLDVIAVFDNRAVSDLDPLAALSPGERALFTHSVFAISEDDFGRNLSFGGYQGYIHVWGKDLLAGQARASDSDPRALKTQIALEYLLANVLARTVDERAGILNVRGLLLSARAVRLDIDLLGFDDPGLSSSIETVSAWRRQWFQNPPDAIAFQGWFLDYLDKLHRYVENVLEREPLAVPVVGRYLYSRNIVVYDGAPFHVRHRGIGFPRAILPIGRAGRKIRKLIHKFECRVPMTATTEPFIAERFAFYRKLGNHQRSHFPKFSILANPVVHRLTRSTKITR